MRKSVYRNEAIQASQKSSLGSVLIIQPLSHYIVTLCICGCGVLLIFISDQLQYSRRIQVSGVLMPEKGLIKIQSQKNGIVLEKLVTEGQHVNAGDTLFVISTDIVSSSEKEPEKKIETVKSIQNSIEQLQANLVKDGKEFEMSLVRQQNYLLASKKNLEKEINQSEIELALQQKNDEFLDQEARFESAKRGRFALDRDLNNVLNELDQIKIKFSRERIQLNQQILELKKSSTSTLPEEKILITAPQAGQVAAVAIEPGQAVSNQVAAV